MQAEESLFPWLTLLSIFVLSFFPFSLVDAGEFGAWKKVEFFCLFHQVWRESKPASLLFLYLKVSCQHFDILSCLLPLSRYEIKF